MSTAAVFVAKFRTSDDVNNNNTLKGYSLCTHTSILPMPFSIVVSPNRQRQSTLHGCNKPSTSATWNTVKNRLNPHFEPITERA